MRSYSQWKNRNSGLVLELEGTRQVGKSGEDFLACFEVIYNWEVGRKRIEGAMHEVFKAYDHDLQDSKSTIVVIDEIQESALIYSRIREFAREFICDFIVTGSYLGKAREKDFFLSAGDTNSLILNALSFPEFLMHLEKENYTINSLLSVERIVRTITT